MCCPLEPAVVCGYWATVSRHEEAVLGALVLSFTRWHRPEIDSENHITCPDVHLVGLLLLLLLNPRILLLQRVDVRGHALHHHAVEGRVVLTPTGIDRARTQLRDVVRPQTLLFIRFCTPGERDEDTVSRGRKGFMSTGDTMPQGSNHQSINQSTNLLQFVWYVFSFGPENRSAFSY